MAVSWARWSARKGWREMLMKFSQTRRCEEPAISTGKPRRGCAGPAVCATVDFELGYGVGLGASIQ